MTYCDHPQPDSQFKRDMERYAMKEKLKVVPSASDIERPTTEQIFEAVSEKFNLTRDEVIDALAEINYDHFKQAHEKESAE